MTIHGIDRQPIRFVVLAGNIREYRNWCAYNGINPATALFVSSIDVLQGRQFTTQTTKFVEIGTFVHRADSREVVEVLRSRLTDGSRLIIEGD